MTILPPEPMHETLSPEALDFFGGANFIVLKLTDYCNLKCKYCHQDALVGKPVLMPMETYKNAIRLILKPSHAPKVYVQFHGGEPLLCPDEFFREAVAFARQELNTPTRQVEFFIQTNLVRVNAAREQLLKELGIGISFSMDGPPEINDELRGGGKHIEQNWRRMHANRTDAGAICLIQPSNWDRMPEVLAYFEREGLYNVRFNLMVPDGRGKGVDTVTTEKLFNAKKIILDYMLATGGEKVVDATLYNAMKRFVRLNGSPASQEYQGCESFYCQAGRSLYSVNPDGRFYACDRIAEAPLWAMGNVNAAFSLPEHDKATRKRHAFQHKDEWWARCEPCPAKKICEFSCSAYYVDAVDTREVECLYTQMMWDYFVERKQDIRAYMMRAARRIPIDDRRPPEAEVGAAEAEESEATALIRNLAEDAAYNQLSLVDIIAANTYFQVYRRGDQYFIYVFKREKIFAVDELVADIARFNGVLPPELVAGLLENRYPPGKLGEAIDNILEFIPEIFYEMKRATQEPIIQHVRERHAEPAI